MNYSLSRGLGLSDGTTWTDNLNVIGDATETGV
jgi:hypothetical protein